MYYPNFPEPLGIAENFSGTLPVYDGREILRRVIDKRFSSNVMAEIRGVLLFSCPLDSFRGLDFPKWDGLDCALAGIGRLGDVTMALYHKPAALHLLDSTVIDVPDGNASLPKILAGKIYREHLLPVCLGPRTPFFITINSPQ